MAVAVYLRVSTEEQRERQSILTQREFGERYCQLHSLSVYRIYADDGVSGTISLDRRAEGSQILEDARQGKFSQLLVYRLDRLGRDTRQILNVVDELEKLNVRVRSMTEEFDTANAAGKLMLTMLCGFASHEHAVIRERSIAGTLRLAEAGAWMGGIVPYGYRKDGEKKNSRLVVSNDIVPGLGMSEADVVRTIYQMAAVERISCRIIAQKLNELKVPCSYPRDDRLMMRGKRKQRTSGMWRAGRVRNMIVSSTYKGVHEYGKRSTKKQTRIISRPVPSLVSPPIWQKAQKTLRSNFLFAKRNARHQYLLRGLIKCQLCGLTFSGSMAVRKSERPEFYYRCNGYQHGRGILGRSGERCTSKALRGDHLEAQIWADVERFLRDPGPTLQQLHAKLGSNASGADKLPQRLKRLELLLNQKAEERKRIVGLYRRGRINAKALDEQMEEIASEELTLKAEIDALRGVATSAESVRKTLGSAESLLAKLRERLDSPVSWELKRELVEILVAGIQVDTIEIEGVRQNQIAVSYRFSEPGDSHELLLSQAYSTNPRPTSPPETIGDHIRRTRIKRKLLQREVAEQLGVEECSIYNWEGNRSKPELRYLPAVVEFLGYNPLPEANGWAQLLVNARSVQGLTQKQSAQELGVDPSTLARWERGEREPRGVFSSRAQQFIRDAS